MMVWRSDYFGKACTLCIRREGHKLLLASSIKRIGLGQLHSTPDLKVWAFALLIRLWSPR
jgi:hypothetical protein